MTLSNVQALVGAAISQIGAVCVAFGAFSSAQSQIIVSGAGTVLAVVFAVIAMLETKKAVAAAQFGRDKI